MTEVPGADRVAELYIQKAEQALAEMEEKRNANPDADVYRELNIAQAYAQVAIAKLI